jgi:septal ring factor EnvC (AmiA/AmiB activator)
VSVDPNTDALAQLANGAAERDAKWAREVVEKDRALHDALEERDDCNREADEERVRVERAEAELIASDRRCRVILAAKNEWADRASRAEAQVAEARKTLDELLEAMERVGYKGESGHVEDFENARVEAMDWLNRSGGPST